MYKTFEKKEQKKIQILLQQVSFAISLVLHKQQIVIPAHTRRDADAKPCANPHLIRQYIKKRRRVDAPFDKAF